MSELNRDNDTDEILEKFPFNRQKLQKQKLSKYFIYSPGLNKADIQKKIGISQPTIRKIQNAFTDLSEKQKTELLDDMLDYFKKNIV